jgi:hypothetical protein
MEALFSPPVATGDAASFPVFDFVAKPAAGAARQFDRGRERAFFDQVVDGGSGKTGFFNDFRKSEDMGHPKYLLAVSGCLNYILGFNPSN